MRVLALDTTTRGGSVAVLDGDQLLAEIAGDASQTHTERLPGECDKVLTLAGVSRTSIDLYVVATGPGAFTGLRIGLAAVQGLALVLACFCAFFAGRRFLFCAFRPCLSPGGNLA